MQVAFLSRCAIHLLGQIRKSQLRSRKYHIFAILEDVSLSEDQLETIRPILFTPRVLGNNSRSCGSNRPIVQLDFMSTEFDSIREYHSEMASRLTVNLTILGSLTW